MCNIPFQLPVNGAVDNTHYTTFAWTEKQSQLEMLAVNSGVLCTLNARNASSQYGVHDEQTVRFYCHITLHRPVCMCAKNASVANKQTSTIFVGAHTSEQNTHHFHFTFISFTLSSWALSSTLLLLNEEYCHTALGYTNWSTVGTRSHTTWVS